MRRIKAKKKKTEILYIFFGIHIATLVHFAERLYEQTKAEITRTIKRWRPQQRTPYKKSPKVTGNHQNDGKTAENAMTAKQEPKR